MDTPIEIRRRNGESRTEQECPTTRISLRPRRSTQNASSTANTTPSVNLPKDSTDVLKMEDSINVLLHRPASGSGRPDFTSPILDVEVLGLSEGK